MPITKYPRVGDIPEILPSEDPSLLLPEDDTSFEETLQDLRQNRDVSALEPRSREQTLEEFRTTRAPQTISKPQSNLDFESGMELTKVAPSEEAISQNVRTQEPLSEDDELRKAQNWDSIGRLSSIFGKSLANIGAGYAASKLGSAPIKIDEESLEAGAKLGKVPLEHLMQRREEDFKKTGREKLKLEYQKIKDANDPNSVSSKQYASLAQQVIDSEPGMKGTIVKNMSEAQIEKSLPWIKEKLESLKADKKLKAEARDKALDREIKLKGVGKGERAAIRELQKTFNKDIAPVKAKEEIVKELNSILTSKNSIGMNAIGSRFARLVGDEKGPLSDFDVNQYQGSPLLKEKLLRWKAGKFGDDETGTAYSANDVKAMKELVGIMRQHVMERRKDIIDTHVYQGSKAFGLDPEVTHSYLLDAAKDDGKLPQSTSQKSSDVQQDAPKKESSESKPTTVKIKKSEMEAGYKPVIRNGKTVLVDKSGNVIREL